MKKPNRLPKNNKQPDLFALHLIHIALDKKLLTEQLTQMTQLQTKLTAAIDWID